MKLTFIHLILLTLIGSLLTIGCGKSDDSLANPLNTVKDNTSKDKQQRDDADEDEDEGNNDQQGSDD